MPQDGGIRGQVGLSLIEVMVAVVVLSLGLLGMAALMGVSIKNTQSANYRTQATNLSYDLIDKIRTNKSKMGSYVSANFNTVGPACSAAPLPADYAACGTSQACDLAVWQLRLCQTLPNGRGRVQITPGSSSILGTSYPTYAVTVSVCWTDDRSKDDVTLSAGCTNTNPLTGGSETLFTVTSGL